MLAAIKPTVGRVSRYGVIPITADQDTAGPMAKYVTDAAICSARSKARRRIRTTRPPARARAPPNRDYRPHLKADALKGARIGIPRAFFYDRITVPGEKEPRGGLNRCAADGDDRGHRRS